MTHRSATLPVLAPRSRATFSTCDPAQPTAEVARYDMATPEDLNDLIALAQSGFQIWSKMSANSRCDALSDWLDLIADNSESIAAEMTAEQGKPLAESRGEIGKSLREARQMLGFARAHSGQLLPGRAPGWSNQILRRPRGIVAAIAPWNFPVLTPLRKMIPALATGNSVVLKPSEFTPAAAMTMIALAKDVLPEGVVVLANGAGAVAATLVKHPQIAAVTFTGSVETGRKVAVAAAENLVPVSLELGGKNGVIVDQIENLDSALDAIVAAGLQCAGQRCTSISRVICHSAILDRVRDGLVARLNALVAGPGRDDTTTLGPITTQAQIEKIQSLVAASIAQGAICHLGGTRLTPDTAPEGRFFAPTLLEVSDAQNPAAQQEVFGPVLTLLRYDTDDAALALLNNTSFGLTSAIFTDRLDFAQRALAEAETGMIHINCGTVPDDNMPFVGTKNSGLGIGSVGPSTLDFFTTEHAAYVTTN